MAMAIQINVPSYGEKLPKEEKDSTLNQTNDIDNSTALPLPRIQALEVYQVALPIILGLIILIGIIGNTMVIIVIATQRKLRTVTNFLLLNLAIADVAFLVICGPFVMAHYALDTWPLGDAMCKVIQYFLYVTCYVTMYTLVAVAVVRYVLMVRLSTHPGVKDPRYITIVISGIWIASLLLNAPVPMIHTAAYNNISQSIECTIIVSSENDRTFPRVFFSTFFVFAYALPLLIIGILYSLIVHYLHISHKNSMLRKKKTPDNGPANEHAKKRSHVTRLLTLVVMVFAACWLPVHVQLLVYSFGTLPDTFTYRMLLIVWYVLVYANSALNPIIYHFFSSEFREHFKKICIPDFKKTTSSSSGLTSRGALMKTSA